MPWADSGTILSTKEKVQVDKQDGFEISGYQPFVTWLDTNANAQARIQNANGNIVFYTQSAIGATIPSVVFNTFSTTPPPPAIEVHAQDGLHIVGYQPFITLDDADSGYALARVQNARGDLAFFTAGAMAAKRASMVLHNDGSAELIGPLTVQRDILLAGGDCAEQFEKSSSEPLDPGTVVTLDDCGSVRRSSTAYDKKVAGVVSGAGTFKTGIVLNGEAASKNSATIALVGRVYCKVDAGYSEVETGDLLTSSDTPGHAMKALDSTRAFGSVIGKALAGIRSGRGLIPILVALQ